MQAQLAGDPFLATHVPLQAVEFAGSNTHTKWVMSQLVHDNLTRGPSVGLDGAHNLVPNLISFNGQMVWWVTMVGCTLYSGFLKQTELGRIKISAQRHNPLWNFLQGGHSPLQAVYKMDKTPLIRWTKAPSDKTPFADHCHRNLGILALLLACNSEMDKIPSMRWTKITQAYQQYFGFTEK